MERDAHNSNLVSSRTDNSRGREGVTHSGAAPFPWRNVNDYIPSSYTENIWQPKISLLVE